MKPTLDELGVHCRTDKSSLYHNYLNRLEPYFDRLPLCVRLLEIGVLEARSIRMWLDYFPAGEIHGVDVRAVHAVSDPRFTFHHADATQPWFWDSVGKFHLIIDDGNHNYAQVAAAYNQGFNHVESGGLYVIEDTCRTDYHIANLMRPSLDELQDHDRDWCGDPKRDAGRFSFIHFYKGLILIGRK